MFKITFIDSVKRSKQYWNIEEHRTTYIFGRNCLNFFSSMGVKKNECYVDIYSDEDTAISKDQIYVTFSSNNVLEIKFKNKLKTFSADRECTKVDDMMYEYYYIEAKKTEKVKFKADKNRYIIRVEYDDNIRTGDKQYEINLMNSDSLVARKNFSVDQLASASLNPNENQENEEILKNNVILKEVQNECILESSNISDKPQKIKEASSDDHVDIIKLDKKTNRENGSVIKPKSNAERKSKSTTTAALAKKEKQKATVNNLMNTLYEAQKKNIQFNKDRAAQGAEDNKSLDDCGIQIGTKRFYLKQMDTNTNGASLGNDEGKSRVNYKRFKKRKLGDVGSKINSFLCSNQSKLIMRKYEDPKIPKFQTMKDLEVDTRYMSVETKDKLKQARTYMGSRKKTSETKHLFLDD